MSGQEHNGTSHQERDPDIGGGAVDNPKLRPHFDEGTEEGKQTR